MMKYFLKISSGQSQSEKMQLQYYNFLMRMKKYEIFEAILSSTRL